MFRSHAGESRPAAGRLAAALLGLLLGCSPGAPAPEAEPAAERPNLLWIVWDTVRADRLSLYGFHRQTTPRLERWARQARVFENCLATASSTVPNHAGMFTGLLPTEHGAYQNQQWLDDRHQTVAELLRASGYQTYLWAANPHVSSELNLQQGFERQEHPWDPGQHRRAVQIVRRKVTGDRSNKIAQRLAKGTATEWMIKAAGELAQERVEHWLDARDPDRPWFVFLNYMEAHRPYIPPRAYRERLMTPEQVERSYQIDHSWIPLWSYTFGLHDFSDAELEIVSTTYDATLLELDDLFADLLASLEARGALENTIVILTADHGEHLGEHHMLDHQYTLYNPVLRVPLVIHYPPRVTPGRESAPVSNFDLFPTVLELTGVEPPEGLRSRAVSLLAPEPSRRRYAEYPSVFESPIEKVEEQHPEWDGSAWRRRLRALSLSGWKLIWADDGRHELYDEETDPLEETNLLDRRPEVARRMLQELETLVASLGVDESDRRRGTEVSPETLKMLEALGYAGDPPGAPEAEGRP